jgi:hypothetical protein
MASKFTVVLAAIAVSIPAMLLTMGVTDAHGGEEHATSAADGFSRFSELGLGVTVIGVGLVCWLRNRGRSGEARVPDSAGGEKRGTPQPELWDPAWLDRTLVGTTMTERTVGPAPESR